MYRGDVVTKSIHFIEFPKINPTQKKKKKNSYHSIVMLPYASHTVLVVTLKQRVTFQSVCCHT